MTGAYSLFAMHFMPEDPIDYVRVVTAVHVPEILVSLRDGPLNNRVIATQSFMDESLCRRHLAYLVDTGLVARDDRKMYSLTRRGSIFADILYELFLQSRAICLLDSDPEITRFHENGVVI